MEHILSFKKPLENFLQDYLSKQVGSIYEPVDYILELGGKRLRPCLLLALTQAMEADVEGALPLAAAIEVFHNFTLLHDDIMDDASQRRGQEAVHVKWNRDQAILSGDIMFAMSYELLAQVESPSAGDILKLFTQTAKQVCVGQQMDMEFESRNNVTEEEYLEMIRLKTSVLIGAATGAAALFAGKDEATYQALYDYGLYLGLSFQLQDDLLDAFGSQAAVGKRIGGDILQNKKTMLFLKASVLADTEQAAILNKWYAQEVDSQEKIDQVKAIMKACGAVEAVRSLQSEYQAKAIQSLSFSGLSGDWFDRLTALVAEQDKRAY
jgi:geranylgeranyl diphosphate synthase type II